MSYPRLCSSTLPIAVALAVVMVLAAPAGATVPGENGAIAFESSWEVWVVQPDGSSRLASHREVWVVQPDGSGLRRLTHNGWSPDWSPDGRRIAFVSDREGSAAIYVMAADGSEVRLIGPGTEPAWSPDGWRLAFVHGADIWVMNTDGSDRRLLTDPASDTWTSPDGGRFPGQSDGNPFWSPDGTRIAFQRLYGGYDSRLYSIPASGGTPTKIRDMLRETWDDWSPDGTRLVGTRGELGMSGLGRMSLQVATADGDEGWPLPVGGELGSELYADPGWSPAGDRLVAAVGPWGGPPATVVTMNLDGSGVTHLPGGWQGGDHLSPSRGAQPDWQALNPYPLVLVDPETGVWHLRGADAAITSFYYGNPGDVPMMGDWNGDGIDTPGLFRSSDGYVYLRNSNNQGVAEVRFYFGNPGDIPLAGDFDGDGFDTVSLYRPSEGRVYIINRLGSGDAGLGAADLDYYFGNPGDKPFVGDFDGDGVDTVGFHREATGHVYYRNDHRQGPAQWSILFGDPGDRVVAHDWNRDGADSVAVFRPSNAKLYILFSNTTGVADREYFFGDGNWLPVTGTFAMP